MRTRVPSQVTVSAVHTLADRVTLLPTVTSSLTNASLRLAPIPSAQPSPAGSPWETIPACWFLASPLGLTQSSTEPLVASTGAVTVSPAARRTAEPAPAKGPGTPKLGEPA